MKVCLWTGLFLFFALYANAQEGRTSAEQALPPDSSRLDYVYKLAEAQLIVDQYEEAERLALEAVKLAEALNDTSARISSKLLLANVYRASNKYPEATSYYLQATSLLEELNEQRMLANVYDEMGLMYGEWSLHEKALEYYLKSYEIRSSLDDVEGEINVLKQIGNSYLLLDDFDNSYNYYQKILNQYNKVNDTLGTIEIFKTLADIYNRTERNNEAQYYNFKILKLYQELNDSSGVTQYLNKVAINYKSVEKFEEALDYFTSALQYNEALLDQGKPAVDHDILLMNIGIMYQYLGQFQSSVNYFLESLNNEGQQEEVSRPAERSELLNEMAYSHLRLGDRKSAKTTSEKALKLAFESKNKETLMNSYKVISDIYKELGIFKKSLEYYQRHTYIKDSLYNAQRLQEEEILKNQTVVETMEQEMKNLLVEREKNELTLKQYQLESETQDQRIALLQSEKEFQSLLLRQNKAEKENELARQKQEFELRQKEQENQSLEDSIKIQELNLTTSKLRTKEARRENEVLLQEQRIKDLELSRASAQSIFFIGAFIILAILIFLILRSYHLKRKANTILAKQNAEIQNQKDEIEQSYHNVKLLSDIAKEITSELTFEGIIKAAYRNIKTFMDATEFGVGIYNRKTDRIEFPHAMSRGEELPKLFFSLEDQARLAVRCYLNSEEIMISDYGQEIKEYTDVIPPSKTGEDALSIMYLPLVVKSRTIGVITVQSFETSAYTEYHRYILANLAIHIAIALENANTYQEIADKTNKLEKAFSDLKAAQTKLVQSEKMASLGLLTAGVAHEINNPINFVYAGVDGLKVSLEGLLEVLNKYEEFEKIRDIQQLLALLEDVQQLKAELFFEETKNSIFEVVGAIREGAQRTAEIVNGLRNFSRLDETELKNADVHKGIDNTILLLNNKIKRKNIKINRDYDPDLQKIICYPGQLNQVFMNVLSNALDAIQHEAGEINITTRKVEEELFIHIQDNGCGMSEPTRNRIFEPFYTTKDMGQGTGLGLSISFGIIQKHKGRIEVSSEPGKGTEFCIILPAEVTELAQVS